MQSESTVCRKTWKPEKPVDTKVITTESLVEIYQFVDMAALREIQVKWHLRTQGIWRASKSAGFMVCAGDRRTNKPIMMVTT